MRKRKIYALYHGDEFKIVGTIKELAEYLGVSERTIKFYSTPTYKKRVKDNAYIVIKVEEE